MRIFNKNNLIYIIYSYNILIKIFHKYSPYRIFSLSFSSYHYIRRLIYIQFKIYLNDKTHKNLQINKITLLMWISKTKTS